MGSKWTRLSSQVFMDCVLNCVVTLMSVDLWASKVKLENVELLTTVPHPAEHGTVVCLLGTAVCVCRALPGTWSVMRQLKGRCSANLASALITDGRDLFKIIAYVTKQTLEARVAEDRWSWETKRKTPPALPPWFSLSVFSFGNPEHKLLC